MHHPFGVTAEFEHEAGSFLIDANDIMKDKRLDEDSEGLCLLWMIMRMTLDMKLICEI